MKILVDADACPVKDIIVREAKRRRIEVVMVCDTSHMLQDGYSRVVTVDKGKDGADFKLIGLAGAGDIVVTQDYGVGAMALAKGAKAINPGGLIYTAQNMDRLLFERHLGAKERRMGHTISRMKKRTRQDDEAFCHGLLRLLDELA